MDDIMPHKPFCQKAVSCYRLSIGYDQRGSQCSGKDGESQYYGPGRKPEPFCVHGSLYAEQTVQ